jgi:hypothetical protein
LPADFLLNPSGSICGCRERANTQDAEFIERGADFAATIHNVPKEHLLSQEVR